MVQAFLAEKFSEHLLIREPENIYLVSWNYINNVVINYRIQIQSKSCEGEILKNKSNKNCS